jgi:hypothetical protein
MKKLLILSLLAMVLVLGACSKEKDGFAEKANTTPKQEQVKEKTNELTYEVNGEKKTVPAEEKTVGALGKTIKLPEGFKIQEYEDHDTGITETSNTNDNGLTITFMKHSYKKIFYKDFYERADAVDIEETDKTGYPNIDKQFNYVITGTAPDSKMIDIVRNPGDKKDTISIKITIPVEKATPEMEAKILSMINSMYN